MTQTIILDVTPALADILGFVAVVLALGFILGKAAGGRRG
jgi:hypothetical protein